MPDPGPYRDDHGGLERRAPGPRHHTDGPARPGSSAVAPRCGRRGAALRRPAGISRGDYDVLATLRRAGTPLTPGKLQEGLLLSSAGMSGRLNRLERAGRVERRPSEADGRVVLVHLTSPGRDLVDRLVHEDMERQAVLLGRLSAVRAARRCATAPASCSTASRRPRPSAPSLIVAFHTRYAQHELQRQASEERGLPTGHLGKPLGVQRHVDVRRIHAHQRHEQQPSARAARTGVSGHQRPSKLRHAAGVDQLAVGGQVVGHDRLEGLRDHEVEYHR